MLGIIKDTIRSIQPVQVTTGRQTTAASSLTVQPGAGLPSGEGTRRRAKLSARQAPDNV